VAVRADAPPGAEIAWAALAGAFGCVGLFAFYRGLASGAMSIVAPIAGTAAVIPVVYGLARGDDASTLQQLGFAAAILGVALSSWEKTELGRAVATGTGFALAATAAFGGYFVFMHAASTDDFLWPALVFRATFTAIAWSAVLLLAQPLALPRRHLLPILLIGVLDTGGNTLFAAAAQRGLVSVVSVLGSLYPVVTVALARLHLREHVHATQEVGIVFALAGIVLVSAG
jgi:drug/metabolite transporter (DMT)-like permease